MEIDTLVASLCFWRVTNGSWYQLIEVHKSLVPIPISADTVLILAETRVEEETWYYRTDKNRRHFKEGEETLMTFQCHTGVTWEPSGISLCCDAIDLWTVLEDGLCSGDLHWGSQDKTEDENVGLLSSLFLCVLLSPMVSLRFHFYFGLFFPPLPPSIPLHVEDLLSSLLSPSSPHHHLEANLKIWNKAKAKAIVCCTSVTFKYTENIFSESALDSEQFCFTLTLYFSAKFETISVISAGIIL